jgi:dTDP-4-amino-4,6-dideoxygalactose transaminase
MNDVTACMALEQLKKLPMFMEKRARVHNFYDEHLKEFSWIDLPPALPDYVQTSYYFYHIQIKNGKRDQFARFLRENGIYTTYRYYPLHRVAGYGVTGDFPNADYAADHTLNLPLHQTISDEELDYIYEKVREFDERYC